MLYVYIIWVDRKHWQQKWQLRKNYIFIVIFMVIILGLNGPIYNK